MAWPRNLGLATSRESKAHLASPGYAPGTIAVSITWMDRGFNAGQTRRSMYPSVFNRLRAIETLVGNCNFSYPLAFNALVGVFPLEFRLDLRKLESWGYTRQWSRFDDRLKLSRFDTIPACDGRTDVQPITITCVSLLTHVKTVSSTNNRVSIVLIKKTFA